MPLSPQTRETKPETEFERKQAAESLLTGADRESPERADADTGLGQLDQALGGEESLKALAVAKLKTGLAAAGAAKEQAETSLGDSELQRILAENGDDPKKALLAILNSLAVGQNVEPHELAEFVEGLGAERQNLDRPN